MVVRYGGRVSQGNDSRMECETATAVKDGAGWRLGTDDDACRTTEKRGDGSDEENRRWSASCPGGGRERVRGE